MVTAWGWLGFRSRQAEEVAYQLRLSRWGGRSQELPRNSASLYRFRKFVGDEIYFGLTGSDGRIVGNDRVAHLDGDATREQLDELLERQPIRTALVAGSKHLGDDWLAGLEEPGAMLALALDGTAITDRSADFLVKMKNLSSLSLVDTAISDVAIARSAAPTSVPSDSSTTGSWTTREHRPPAPGASFASRAWSRSTACPAPPIMSV
jgi:hypothetical protein